MKSNLVRSVRNSFFLAVAAGIFIGVGGSVLLSCDNRYLGAVLFSIALLAICTLGLYLFTGKIGYLWNSHTLTDVCCIVAGLLGNMAGTWLSATALRFCRAPLIDVVRPMVDAKLTQALFDLHRRLARGGEIFAVHVKVEHNLFRHCAPCSPQGRCYTEYRTPRTSAYRCRG